MTQNEFAAICEEMTISPAVALESEAVQYALQWAKKTTNEATAAAIVRAALEGNF
jgi:hypothetical protein